uniref:Uncharacterized protein n=1 Tax=mine drainage metagenome TaxID=410659 RepID=E6Q0T3_9ZZZZ
MFPIDGYVVDERSKAITAIFKKLIIIDSNNLPTASASLAAEILARADVVGPAALAAMMRIPFHAVIFHESLGILPVDEKAHSLLVVSKYPGKLSTCTSRSVSDLRHTLRRYRGKSFPTSKALISAGTNLECYLANNATPDKNFDPWPGDFDAVLFDLNTNEVRSLVEFKTHNRDLPTSAEWLGKYPEDKYRVDVLFALRDAIASCQKTPIELKYVVWGTREYETHRDLIITTVVDRNDLKGNKSVSFLRPTFGQYDANVLAALI